MQTNPSIRVEHLFIADIFGIKSDSDIQCILKKSPPPLSNPIDFSLVTFMILVFIKQGICVFNISFRTFQQNILKWYYNILKCLKKSSDVCKSAMNMQYCILSALYLISSFFHFLQKTNTFMYLDMI